MLQWRKAFRISVTAVLMFGSLSSGVQGQVAIGGAGFSFGGESRGVTRITGKIVCASCELGEVHKGQPDLRDLYQLTHRSGQMVLEIHSSNDERSFDVLAWPPQLWVRAKDEVFQQLTAEE